MGQRLPPVDARPLSQILEAVEKSHSGTIVGAEGRSCGKPRVDPRYAKTLLDSCDLDCDIRPSEGGNTSAQIGREIEPFRA